MKKKRIQKKFVTLTFDVEDWFQVESFKERFSIQDWEHQKLRVEIGTEKILNLLKRYNIKATFFVLGWVAERVPELVRKIHKDGHEVASHGYNHQLNYKMSEKELYIDLEKSKNILERIIDNDVAGYRAPTFSVDDRVLKIINKLGFQYDSSYNQFSGHSRYGVLSKKSEDVVFETNDIIENSLPAIKFLGREFPIAGGGFFRIYPLWLTKKFVMKFFNTNDYYIFYAHPWEFDTNMPKVKGISFQNKFRHYVNININYKKVEKFIKYLHTLDCTFLTMKEYLKKYQESRAIDE